jgi:hypothetical protein
VTKYCLMSAAGSYTDFHVDFGGTSVWVSLSGRFDDFLKKVIDSFSHRVFRLFRRSLLYCRRSSITFTSAARSFTSSSRRPGI